MSNKKATGRPRIDSVIPLETIIDVFLKADSKVAAARKLGISARTLERELRLAKVDPRKPRCRAGVSENADKPWNLDFDTAPHVWFKQHPENLEHSPKRLAKLIGCPEKQVRDYLYRKRIALELFLQTLGNLREAPGKLVTVREEAFFCRFITDYRLHVDPVSLVVTIRGFTTAAGTFTAKIGFVEYCKIFGRRIDPRSFFRGGVWPRCPGQARTTT